MIHNDKPSLFVRVVDDLFDLRVGRVGNKLHGLADANQIHVQSTRGPFHAQYDLNYMEIWE